MPFDGSGNFVAPTVTGYPAVAGQKIRASTFNNVLQDVFDGLGDCMTRAGEAPATADIPFGGFKATGLADGSATGDALAYGQATAAYLQKLLTGAGAAATPAIYPTGDADTGRWYPEADTVAESVGGTELLRWNATGFGVGVTPGAKFHVKGTGGFVRFETTTARGSGANYLSWMDPTGEAGVLGFVTANNDLYLANRLNGSLLFMVNNAVGLTLAAGGTLTSVAGLVAGTSVTATTSLNGATLSLSGNASVGGDASVVGNLSLTGMGGNVAAGTYTPTASGLVNLDSATPTVFNYIRIGGLVHVTGAISVDFTAAGVAAVQLTLPVASNFAAGGDCSGVAVSYPDSCVGIVQQDVTTDKAEVQVVANDTSTETFHVCFTYQIK